MQYGVPCPFPLMSVPRDRTLLKALIASLAVHAFLLADVSPFLPMKPEAPLTAIAVSFRASAGEKTLPQARERSAQSVPAIPAIETKRKMEKRSTQVLAAANRPSIDRVVPERVLPSMESEPAKRLTASDAAPASGGGDVRPSGAVAPPAYEEGVSAEAVRQYRTSLAISAKRFKRYPVLARERGWEGSVEVVLDFRRELPGPEIAIVSSSGKAVLDEQGVEMIRQAARATEVPDGLKGRNFRMRMPISFSLSDER